MWGIWAMRGGPNLDAASVLAILGGLLILIEAVFFASALSGPASSYLVFGLVAGVAIIALAVLLRGNPQQRTGIGFAITVLSLASFFGISGFYLGALLGLIGGILTITSAGRPFPNPMSSSRSTWSMGTPCGRCGHPIPSWTSKCPYCGYPGS